MNNSKIRPPPRINKPQNKALFKFGLLLTYFKLQARHPYPLGMPFSCLRTLVRHKRMDNGSINK